MRSSGYVTYLLDKLHVSCLSLCSISMESLYVNVRGLEGKCREESLPEPASAVCLVGDIIAVSVQIYLSHACRVQ